MRKRGGALGGGGGKSTNVPAAAAGAGVPGFGAVGMPGGSSNAGGGSSTSSSGAGAASSSTGGVTGGGGGGSSSGGGGSSSPAAAQTSTPAPNPNAPAGSPTDGTTKAKKLKFNTAYASRMWGYLHWQKPSEYKTHELAEVKRYSTNEGYVPANAVLRQTKGDLSLLDDTNYKVVDYTGKEILPNNSTMKNRIAKLDKAFDFAKKMPSWATFTRGTDQLEFSELGITLGSSDADMLDLKGKKYTNHGYTSMSHGDVPAMSDKNVHIVFTVRPGTRAIHMAGNGAYGDAIATLTSENEMLLDRGAKFRITKVTKTNKGYNMATRWDFEVEVIG